MLNKAFTSYIRVSRARIGIVVVTRLKETPRSAPFWPPGRSFRHLEAVRAVFPRPLLATSGKTQRGKSEWLDTVLVSQNAF